MSLQKQNININFSQGIDTKTDPFQIQMGKFNSLQNSVFDKAGRLTKRNGYTALTQLPDSTTKYLTTFNGNLTAIGDNIRAYSDSNAKWVDKGSFQSLSLSTIPAVRGSTYQGQADSVTTANGLSCIAYTDFVPSGGSVVAIPKYAVVDSITGQNIIPPTELDDADPDYGTPRVFLLGGYFIILYTTQPTNYQLEYIAVSIADPSIVSSPVVISNDYTPASTLAFDGVVSADRLYVAYNTTAGGQSIKATYIGTTLGLPIVATTFATEIATMFSMTTDETNPSSPIIYVNYFDAASQDAKVLAVDFNLNQVLAPTLMWTGLDALNIASSATGGVCTAFYEIDNDYTYSATATHYIRSLTVTQGGIVGTPEVTARSVGLASKAFRYGDYVYYLAAYDSDFQPSYFLMKFIAAGTPSEVAGKLAYSNGGGYLELGLPNISLNGTVVSIPYLYKALVQAINRTQGVADATGVYSQLGINLVKFDFEPAFINTSEIGSNLNLSGGFISMYDGISLTEQGFFLYPDSLDSTIINSGGSITQQQYFYIATYEWIDNQGNVFRSAPSLPLSVNVGVGGGSASVDLDIPTLRLTHKLDNPVQIVLYRWSTAQQTYYQVTSIIAPILNDVSVDSITYTDTASDASILGNNILYTTGGVIENISPPGSDIMTLFDNRLWLVDSEDRNLLWFSKIVVEATPVEMSDLLTRYIAPSASSEGSTGPITALAPMDDKLIVFKENALGYITGTGPDITGVNSQYTEFTLINSVVGCSNSQSIVITPTGLMFQSNKGIWLLSRNLDVQYIGAPVESLTTNATVLSAFNVPATNQVRFTMDTGITLMYDYYFNQWGTFTRVPALSSTIYENLHTYVNSYGQVLQETPGVYLDNTSPVLMNFTTGWINFAGIQGFQRFYEMYFLGQYLSPFKLNTQIAYDYNSSPAQATLITPPQNPSTWGSTALWGSDVWGQTQPIDWESQAQVFEARLFPQRQKCESFQITVTEVYDAAAGGSAGAGLTLSGLNLVLGMKRGHRTSKASRNFG